MTKTILLGAIFAAVFSIALISQVNADNPAYMEIDTPGEFTMTVDSKIPQIVDSKSGRDNVQQGLVTFWSWVIDDTDDTFTVAVVAIHHSFNDHQFAGTDFKSKPVQRFHPHTVTVNKATGCVAGLTSPTWDFRVKGDTVTLESDATQITVDLGDGEIDNITGWLNLDDENNPQCADTDFPLVVTAASAGLS